jgi:2-haloalkanoic acid dehalogenase type II
VRLYPKGFVGSRGTLVGEATRIHLVTITHGTLRGLLGDHKRRLAFIRQPATNRSERSPVRPSHAGVPSTATFPDVRPALESLAGVPLATNGSTRMLQRVVRTSGLEPHFAEIISVDRVKTYKPSPRVYSLGPEILDLSAKEILFVSSNPWDAAGAKAFGCRICRCNPEDTQGKRNA